MLPELVYCLWAGTASFHVLKFQRCHIDWDDRRRRRVRGGIKFFWQPIRPGVDTQGSPSRLCLVSIKSTLILYLSVDRTSTSRMCASVRQRAHLCGGEIKRCKMTRNRRKERGHVRRVRFSVCVFLSPLSDLETNNFFRAYKDARMLWILTK